MATLRFYPKRAETSARAQERKGGAPSSERYCASRVPLFPLAKYAAMGRKSLRFLICNKISPFVWFLIYGEFSKVSFVNNFLESEYHATVTERKIFS